MAETTVGGEEMNDKREIPIAEDLREDYQECGEKSCLICRLIERTSRAEAALAEVREIFERQSSAICGNAQLSGCEEFYRGYNAVVRRENVAGAKGVRIIDSALTRAKEIANG